MPIAKFDNTEKESISQAGIDSGNFSAKPSVCSCINCDSKNCFEKRKKEDKKLCQCGICKNCFTLPKTDSQEKKFDLQSESKKIIREVVTRQTIESLKRVTETMYQVDNLSKYKNMKVTSTKSDISIKTGYNKNNSTDDKEKSDKSECYKKNSTDQNDIRTKKECYKQQCNVQILNNDGCESHKDENTATKLSALVMNVPYKDLHESVPSLQQLIEEKPLSKLNIFQRIKEIYDACSCKVCECISSKPRDLHDDFCKCKPCECQDCVKLRYKMEDKIRHVSQSGCPCIRCDYKDCRSIVNDTYKRGIIKDTGEIKISDYNTIDKVQNPENITDHSKQCINCRIDSPSSKTVKLGQAEKIIERDTCQCLPCECIECKQIYSRTNPNVMYTESSGTTKYGNHCLCDDCRTERCQLSNIETCQCEGYNRAMRNTNDNDYDVHTVIVDSNGPFNQKKECYFENNNNISFFNSLKNKYPSTSCNKDICKCTECECIVCSTRDSSSGYREVRPNAMSVHRYNKLPIHLMNACKCTPCECEICSKNGEREDSILFDSKCRCEICDCLNCDNASLPASFIPTSSFTPISMRKHQPAKPIRSIDMNSNCTCNPCDCSNCKNLYSCSSSVKHYFNGKSAERKTTRRLRKVMLVTPASSESHFKSHKTDVRRKTSTNLSPKKSTEGAFRQDFSTCCAVSDNYVTTTQLSRTNKDVLSQLYQNNKESNCISQNVDTVDYPVVDNASIKSLGERPQLNYLCDITHSTFKTNKLINPNQNKTNEKDFSSNNSHDSLPIFWTCRNETPQPSFFRNIEIAGTRSHLKDNLFDGIYINKQDFNKSNNFIKKAGDMSMNQIIYKGNSKVCNVCPEYLKQSYCSGNFNYNSEDTHIQRGQESCNNRETIGTCVKHTSKENNNSIVNQSDIVIDYERASRILCEAKDFTSKLLEMLDGFEKANSQFESASQKFKILHDSLLNLNKDDIHEKYTSNLRSVPRPKFEDTFEIISKVQHYPKQSTVDNLKNENEAEREYETSVPKPSETCDNFQYTENSTPSYHDILYINKIIVDTNDINTQECNTNKFDNMNISLKTNSQLQFDKEYNKLIKSSSNESAHLHCSTSTYVNPSLPDLNKESTNKIEYKNVPNGTRTPTMKPVITDLNSTFVNMTPADTSVMRNAVGENLLDSPKQKNKPWHLFEKNFYIDAESQAEYGRKTFKAPVLALNIKQTIQTISLKPTEENFVNVIPRPNEALSNLQNEVNDLLNMSSKSKYQIKPDSHLIPRSKLDLEFKAMSSTASSKTTDTYITRPDKEVYFKTNSETMKGSCEQLKAHFISLRKVSDHTVLVKWNVPERVKDVQGYELLVDGCSVQKIFSPTRDMAVVTCMPPVARVLLTIRTITAVDCGHAPTTSIVYRPRTK